MHNFIKSIVIQENKGVLVNVEASFKCSVLVNKLKKTGS